MKYAILLFTLLCFSCRRNNPDLIGHWHVHGTGDESIFGDYEYITIDILNDTFGICEQYYWGDSGFSGNINQRGGQMLFGGECLVLDFRYQYENGQLILNQIAYDEPEAKSFIGKKCEEGCCDKQKEFLRNSKTYLDLPIAKDTSKLILVDNRRFVFENRLIYGVPKPKYQPLFGKEARLILGDDFGEIKDLDSWDETRKLRVSESNHKFIRRTIYADNTTELDSILPVLEKFKYEKEYKIYFAVRERDLSERLKIWYQPINLKKIDLKIIGKKQLQNWLNEI